MSASRELLARVNGLISLEPEDLGAATGTAGWLHRLCRAAGRELAASGVALSVMTEAGSWGMAACSDPASGVVEELQFTLGEGPCLDAFTSRRPVLAPDLVGDGTTRWPGYSQAAQGHGVRAVFAFPLQVGGARLGALDVYREQSGVLTTAGLAQALTFAEVATTALLDGQEQAGAGRTPAGLDDVLESGSTLHQAQGMVMVQLGVSLAEAMARLRAHAFAQDRSLADVARAIVARKLSLERDET